MLLEGRWPDSADAPLPHRIYYTDLSVQPWSRWPWPTRRRPASPPRPARRTRTSPLSIRSRARSCRWRAVPSCTRSTRPRFSFRRLTAGARTTLAAPPTSPTATASSATAFFTLCPSAWSLARADGCGAESTDGAAHDFANCATRSPLNFRYGNLSTADANFTTYSMTFQARLFLMDLDLNVDLFLGSAACEPLLQEAAYVSMVRPMCDMLAIPRRVTQFTTLLLGVRAAGLATPHSGSTTSVPVSRARTTPS